MCALRPIDGRHACCRRFAEPAPRKPNAAFAGSPRRRRIVDPDALRAMLDAYLAAWRQGDAETCIGFYARDARMEDPLLPAPLEGRDRIREYFRQGFAERPADTTRRLVNVAIGENRIFFEWIIASARSRSRGVSVWDVEDGEVKRDRSYWHAVRGHERDEVVERD